MYIFIYQYTRQADNAPNTEASAAVQGELLTDVKVHFFYKHPTFGGLPSELPAVN
jgi:hypothetical protein